MQLIVLKQAQHELSQAPDDLKKAKTIKFDNARDFGRSLGLTDVEMELTRQKKLMIEKLKAARLQKGISQADLATKILSKQPTIARMESGQVSQVSIDFLLKIALILEVPVTIKPLKKAA